MCACGVGATVGMRVHVVGGTVVMCVRVGLVEL